MRKNLHHDKSNDILFLVFFLSEIFLCICFALQAVFVLFSDDNVMKLPYCIAIAGFVCALFAIGIPHLSALRIWLGFSTFFSLVYIIAAFVLSLRDGEPALSFVLRVYQYLIL